MCIKVCFCSSLSFIRQNYRDININLLKVEGETLPLPTDIPIVCFLASAAKLISQQRRANFPLKPSQRAQIATI